MIILKAVSPFYRPVIEFLMLTGTTHGEIAGLEKSDIHDGLFHIQRSRVPKYSGFGEEGTLKEASRNRRFPITKRINNCLAVLLQRSKEKHVFVMKDGTLYDGAVFREKIWKPALKKAGIAYRPPYALRHTFAAWCLTIGIDMNRLVSLMGHASKEMVFEQYGKYVEGLEMDRENILKFFGADFNRSSTPIEQPLRPQQSGRWGKHKSYEDED